MSGAGTEAAPYDFGMAASAEFWAQAGRSAMQAQEQVGRMRAEAMKAIPGMGGDAPAVAALSPDTAELVRAGQAAPDLWTAATGLSLGAKVGTPEYEELALPGGHVGVFVGGKAQKLFAPAVAAFLQRHDAAGQAEGAPLA